MSRVYKKSNVIEITTTDLCEYGCNQVAKYKAERNKKLCCSKHHNSCPGKRKKFSELDHTARTSKSLATRIEKGITKSSQIKGGATRVKLGHYKRLAESMKHHWDDHPWNSNIQCPLLPFKNTDLNYQGTYEFEFLEELEQEHGIDWIQKNVSRGPSIWYIDPEDNTKRLYISDFIIYNTIYEIKSSWTWNKHGKDLILEAKNKAKLNQCVLDGYKVMLVLDKKEIIYE